MNVLQPRTPVGRLALWALVVALAALPLASRRPWAAWRADLGQEDAGRRLLAVRALARVPDGEVPGTLGALAGVTKDFDAEVAAAAARSLASLAPRGGEVLARAVARGDGARVDEALALLGRGGAAVVPTVIEVLLRSEEPRVRLRALEVFEALGADARAALPELARLDRDPDPEVRRRSLRTLQRVDPGGIELYRLAQRLTRDGEERVRQRAWRVLAILPRTFERARDPRYAAELEAAFLRELPALPEPLRQALDEGLGRPR